MSVISFHCFSQKEKPGTIERDRKGNIASVTFHDALEKSKVPHSAKDFFEHYLEVGASDHFEKVAHKSKKANFIHEHYDQYYKGVKVDGAGYNFHYKDGEMYFVNGHYVRVNNLNASPSISVEKAVDAFLKYKGIEKEKVADRVTELLVKEIDKPTDSETLANVKLVYRIYLQSDHLNNTEVGFVNAHTGEVETTESRLTHLIGTFATRYNGSQQASTDPVSGGHRLFDNTRGATIHTRSMQNNTTLVGGAVDLIDNDNNWTTAEHGANNNDMGLDVHWALQRIYDYLNNTHGINSFNDAGTAINAYVRYGDDNNERDNAAWDPTLDVLYFGQGANTFRPVASLDAVSHEFGHGITDFQIGWGITGDQRAFHEGMSDIWGAILEQRIRPNSAWRIGEQLTLNHSYLRNIQNTNDNNSHTKMADTFQGSQYNNSSDPYVRSGIFSHWFYVLANGEIGTNDHGNIYSVTGIGLDHAEEIIIEAVFNNYLDGTTSYPAIRTAMINAATALYCANSPDVRAVTDAWYAVGVGAAYSGQVIGVTGGSSIICTTSNAFTVQNAPGGTSIVWGSSNLGGLTVNSSGIATRQNGFSGSVNVLASIQSTTPGGCGPSAPASLPVWVGSPILEYIQGPTTVQQNVYYTYYVQSDYSSTYWQPNVSGATFYWYVYGPGGGPAQYTSTVNQKDISFPGPGGYTVVVASQNACGWGFDEPNLDVYVEGFFALSPNPASQNVQVRLVSEETDGSRPGTETAPYRVLVYDMFGVPVLFEEKNTPMFSLSTAHLKDGIYVVELTNGKNVYKKRLMIKH